jgi:hypothetical protein
MGGDGSKTELTGGQGYPICDLVSDTAAGRAKAHWEQIFNPVGSRLGRLKEGTL